MPIAAKGVLGGLSILVGSVIGAPLSGHGPYGCISARNVFGLRPPPPVVKQEPIVPLPKIKLTGITTIFGDKRMLAKVEYPAGAGTAAKEKSVTLVQGQSEGQLEVLEVDIKNSRVTVNNSGTTQVLTFEPTAAAPTTATLARPGYAPQAVRRWGGFVANRR